MHASEDQEPYWPPDPERLSPYWPPVRDMPMPANDDRRHVEDEWQRFMTRSVILHLMPVPDTFPDPPDLGSRVISRPFSIGFRAAYGLLFDDTAHTLRLKRSAPDWEATLSWLRRASPFVTLPSMYPAVYKKPGMHPANLA